jgi:hypothetical protein
MIDDFILGRIFPSWKDVRLSERNAFVLDDGVSEAMKWSAFGGESESLLDSRNYILPLNLELENMDRLRSIKPVHIIFMASWLSSGVLNIMRSMVKASRCRSVLILTSSSHDAAKELDVGSIKSWLSSGLRRFDEGDPYDVIRALLGPAEVAISYFPYHAFPILLTASNPEVSTYLSSFQRSLYVTSAHQR